MKIINKFKKLRKGSKLKLKFKKHSIYIFCTPENSEYGIEIILQGKFKFVHKEYSKFILTTEKRNEDSVIILESVKINKNELEVYSYLIEYMLFELNKIEKVNPLRVKKIVDDWTKFSKRRISEISIKKQIGLIGELIFLKKLIEYFPENNQLNNWNGPEGFKIDFIFSQNFGVEVKSRIQPFKDWISISSIEQLDNELNMQHLLVYDFLPNENGNTLSEYVDDILNTFDDYDQTSIFLEKLKKVSYDHFNKYENLVKVSLFKHQIYNIKNGDFPILKKPEDLRIDRISYQININNIDFFEINTTLATIRNQLEQS